MSSRFSFPLRSFLLIACAFTCSESAFAQTSPTLIDQYPSYYDQSAPGSQPCVAGTLSSYESLGYQGCTVGTSTFYNFSDQYNPILNAPGTAYDPSLITITPGIDPTKPSLTLSSNTYFDLATGSATYYLEYYIDPPIDILGFGLADQPFAGNTYVQADICTNNEYAFDCNYPDSDIGIDPTVFIDAATPSMFTTFAPGTQFADVVLTINVDATNGAASIPAFSAVVLPAPEPDEATLAGIGALALVGTRSRMKRRAKSCARSANRTLAADAFLVPRS